MPFRPVAEGRLFTANHTKADAEASSSGRLKGRTKFNGTLLLKMPVVGSIVRERFVTIHHNVVCPEERLPV